jgi:hypothetical protein
MPNVWVSQSALNTHRDRVTKALEEHFPNRYEDTKENAELLSTALGFSIAYTRKLLVGYGIIQPRRVTKRSENLTQIPDLVIADAGGIFLVLQFRNGKWKTVYDAGNGSASRLVAEAFIEGYKYGCV